MHLTSEKPCLLPPKPIFRGEFIAFSEFDRSSLRKLIRRLDKKSLRIAEIGSWTGDGSTKTVVDELRKSGGVLYCVDHWQGNPGVQRHRDLVSEFDMFATFRSHVSTFEGNEFVRPLVMSSRDAAELVKDCFFDLVFIDGDHSYDETVCDIELWLPKIAPGGILCGHDCEARPGGILDRSHLWPSRNLDTIDGNSRFSKDSSRSDPGSRRKIWQRSASLVRRVNCARRWKGWQIYDLGRVDRRRLDADEWDHANRECSIHKESPGSISERTTEAACYRRTTERVRSIDQRSESFVASAQ